MRYIRQYIKAAPKTGSRPRRAIFHPAVASHQCIAPDVVHRRPFAQPGPSPLSPSSSTFLTRSPLEIAATADGMSGDSVRQAWAITAGACRGCARTYKQGDVDRGHRGRDGFRCYALVGRALPAQPCGSCAIPLSCLFGDDEVAEIGSLFRGFFSPQDE